jgi:hypothetical protein
LTFLGYFLVPGYIHWFRLKTLRSRIAKSEKQKIIPDLKAAFQKDRKLEHLWNEYRESLHYVREERDGQMVLVDLRSTQTPF